MSTNERTDYERPFVIAVNAEHSHKRNSSHATTTTEVLLWWLEQPKCWRLLLKPRKFTPLRLLLCFGVFISSANAEYLSTDEKFMQDLHKIELARLEREKVNNGTTESTTPFSEYQVKDPNVGKGWLDRRETPQCFPDNEKQCVNTFAYYFECCDTDCCMRMQPQMILVLIAIGALIAIIIVYKCFWRGTKKGYKKLKAVLTPSPTPNPSPNPTPEVSQPGDKKPKEKSETKISIEPSEKKVESEVELDSFTPPKFLELKEKWDSGYASTYNSSGYVTNSSLKSYTTNIPMRNIESVDEEQMDKPERISINRLNYPRPWDSEDVTRSALTANSCWTDQMVGSS